MTAVRAGLAPAGVSRKSKARFLNLTAASFEGICITHEGTITDVNEQFATLFRCRRSDVIGQPVIQFVHPDSRGLVAERIRDGKEGCYEHRAVRADGTSFDVEVQAKLITWAGQSVRLSAVRDITERKRTENALRESQERLDLIFQNATDMLMLYAVDRLTPAVLELRLLTANRAFLEGAARVGHPVRLEAIRGQSFDDIMRHTFERDEASIGASKAQVRAAIEARRAMSWEDGTAAYALERTEIPIFGEDGRCRYFLRVLHDVTEQRQTRDALRASEQREQQARMDFTRKLIAGQEAELRRIASELHDGLGQNLLLIKNQSQLAQLAGPGEGALAERLAGVVRLAGEAIAEVRQISHDLRPYQLDQLGLTRALRAMIDAAAGATGIAFTVKLEAVDEVFSADNSIHLYRIVQESLNNILKHSRASRGRVVLERDVHEVRLLVEDDGRGLGRPADAPAEGAGGFGLRNMAERVLILGGRMTLGAPSGPGLALRIVIPIPDPA